MVHHLRYWILALLVYSKIQFVKGLVSNLSISDIDSVCTKNDYLLNVLICIATKYMVYMKASTIEGNYYYNVYIMPILRQICLAIMNISKFLVSS